jgi:hypothetical protein
MTNAYGLSFLRRTPKSAQASRLTPWDDESTPSEVVPPPCTKLSYSGQTYLISETWRGSQLIAVREPVSRPAV